MDDFTKRIMEKAKTRQEATKQKMLELSSQSRSRIQRPGPLNSLNDDSLNIITVSTSSTTSEAQVENQSTPEVEKEVEGKPKTAMSQRLKKILAQRNQWEAEERGESVNVNEAVTPRRYEDPGTNSPVKVVALAKKSKLTALSSRYRSLDDSDDLFPTEYNKSEEQVSSMDASDSTIEPSPTVTVTMVDDTDDVKSKSPVVQEPTKRKSLGEQPVPTKRKSFGAGRILESDPDKLEVVVESSTLKDDDEFVIPSVPVPKEGQHMLTLQDNSFSSLPNEDGSYIHDTSSAMSDQAASTSVGGVSFGESDLDDEYSSLEQNSFVSNQDRSVASVEGGSYCEQDASSISEYSGVGDNKREPSEAELNSLEASMRLKSDEELMSSNYTSTVVSTDDEEESSEIIEQQTPHHLSELSEKLADVKVTSQNEESDAAMGEDDEAGDEFSFGDDDDDEEEQMDENYDSVIDELFTFQDTVSSSAVLNADITYNKSRRQICNELQDRRQVFNEAEDTHTILTRRISRRELLSPPKRLQRSLSTESILSVATPQDKSSKKDEDTPLPSTPSTSSKSNESINNIPVFTIDAYRSDKRKSTKKSAGRPSTSGMQTPIKTARQSIMNYKLQVKKPFAEKLKEIDDSAQRQLAIIKQTSGAINCCYDTKHGKGSENELEAEKLLLVASKTRLALIDEAEALKAKGRAAYEKDGGGAQPCRASVTINKIEIPIKNEYLFANASKKDGGDAKFHYYVVLVKTGGGKILSTELGSTRKNLAGDQLRFKNKFIIENLTSDFEIVLEIYSANLRDRLSGSSQDKNKAKFSTVFAKNPVSSLIDGQMVVGIAEKETPRSKRLMRHGKNTLKRNMTKMSTKLATVRSRKQQPKFKSHNSLRSLTPRKFRARNTSHSSSLASPSPGGPNVVRTSSFSLIGTCTITKEDVHSETHELSNVPFLSPIVGQMRCHMETDFQSVVELRGFLTMFDDVGGMGAWNRRWCALYNGVLSTWEYPTDETLNKRPINQILLHRCVSSMIGPVARIQCARPNVFEFRSMRERRRDERTTLITYETGSVITIKHWIAADSKLERDEWISALNQSLRDVREWDAAALKPFSNPMS